MGINFTLPICDKRIPEVLQEPGLYAPRAAPGSALRSTDLHGKMAPKKPYQGRAIVTRRKVAGMEVRPLLGLWF